MHELRRSLGLTDVAFFFIVTGSNLQWIAAAAAVGPASLAVWIAGGFAMFAPIAIVVVHLASRYPEEGGMYVWTKRAFGPFAGFMTGWSYWTSTLPYFSALLYFAASNALYLSGGSGGALAKTPLYFTIVALAGLALATLVNVFGLGTGKWLNNAGGVSRWTATLLLIGLGIAVWARFGPANTFNARALTPGLHLKDAIFWSVIAFAWVGPECVPFMGGEIRNPRRSIPLGLAIAAPVIAAIYLLGTTGVLAVINSRDVNASTGIMQTFAGGGARFGIAWIVPLCALLVTISCLGSAGAWMGSIARIPFVAGLDSYMPRWFGRIEPRGGAPVNALIVQAIVAAVCVVLGQGGTSVKGAYDVLVGMTLLATFVPFILLFAAAIKLCAGRLTVILAGTVGLCTTLVSIVFSVLPPDDEPNKPLAVLKIVGLTAALIIAGAVIYANSRRAASRSAAAP